MNFSAYSENIEHLNSILSINPESPDAVKAAKYYLQIGDYNKAILLCEDSLNYHPGYLTGYLVLINSFISKSDYTSAQSTLERANKLFPNHWAFKPILRVLDDFGYDEKQLHTSLTYDDDITVQHKEVEIDDVAIDSIVEEAKTGSLIDSFDIDNFLNDAAIDEIDKPHTFENNNLVFPDEFLTINDFKPADNTSKTNHDELINILIDDDNKNTGNVSTKNAELPKNEEPAIKVFNDKYNLENELNQLLSEDDLKTPAIIPYEETIIDEHENRSPKLISKTLAEVFDMQGRYSEAIEVYKALLENNEITSQEYDSKIIILQEKISSNIDI